MYAYICITVNIHRLYKQLIAYQHEALHIVINGLTEPDP